MRQNITLFMVLVLAFASLAIAQSAATPPRPGSFMKINLLDKTSGQPITNGTLSVRIVYDPPYQARSTQYTVDITQANQMVNIALPPDMNVTAHITAAGNGYLASADEITITSQQYWDKVETPVDTSNWGGTVTPVESQDDVSPEQPTSQPLVEKSFTLERNPNYKPPNGTTPGTSSGGCCGTGAILLFALIGLASFGSIRR